MIRMTKVSNSKRGSWRAFSMIELAVVILIIGVLIGGILASQRFIAKFRITTAQTLTISSPIHGISDSVLWLESSLDKSFKDSESSDTNSLSAWYDVRESVNKNNATQSNSGNYPTYSNSINYIQAVKFDGTNGYFTVDGSVLNNTNYTIFVLEQRDSNKSGNYFIGDASSGNDSTTNKNLVLGYSADGTIKHSQSSDNSYTSSITSYSASSGKPRIFTFVHDKSSGKKTYINGLLAATSTDTNHLSGMTNLTIGKSYQGQIGEVAIFARSLTDEERQSVEDYLGKKWNSTILRSAGSSAASGGIGGSCVGGIVGDSGCLTSCTVIAATGITDTTVAGGSGSLTCNTAANFTGSLPYTCLNGIFAYTNLTACRCADGYNQSGSTCVPVNPECSGGTESVVNISGVNYKFHKFLTTGTSSLNCTVSGTVSVLVVAGGGAAGESRHARPGGGGGGGGVLYQSNYSVSVSSYTVKVGAGGNPPNSVTNGGNSQFGTLESIGGGYGGAKFYTANSGGSGGGAGGISNQSGASGTSGQGYNGGNNQTVSTDQNAHCYFPSAGGGGAGAAGGNSNDNLVGVGGQGVLNQITGSDVYYGGGGSGGYADPIFSCSNLSDPSAALGGGGNRASKNGQANTGGGGSGYGYGGSGGSGIVIVRYVD